MVCRLTKLGWFDDPQHREITQEVTKFLQATVEHCILGLYILNELVIEMNQPILGKTLTSHRKTAVSFREVALFHIFQVALTSLRQLQMRNITTERDQEARLADAALSLCIRCLSFDFIGTNPDESGEEVGALQLPSSWRVVVQEPATMQLLFDLYYSLQPPISARCLECLMLLASVRRSLFSPDTERMKFLGFLMTGVRNIITNQQGLSDQQNYHEFCRLLAKCKTNYQLSELIKTDGYVQWLQLVTDFTIKSLNQWQWSSNSVTYLLSFWSRIVSAIPYVRVDHSKKDGEKSGPQLEKFVPQILSSYVQSRLKSAQQSALDLDEMYENLLDDEGSITDQMEKLQTICHYRYRTTGDTLIAAFDPLLAQYEQFVNSTPTSPQEASQIKSIEIQLAWLIHIVGGIIGNTPYASSHHYHHHSSSSSSSSSESSKTEGGDEIIDAEICQRVFQAMQITEQRLIASGGQFKCDEHLELSLLDYIHNFRKSYIGEQHGMPSPTSPPLVSTGTLSMKTKAYMRMFDHLRLGDHTVVVNMLVTKIGNNLKFWGQNSVIVGKTLNLFLDIASGYSSGKLLLSLDTVQYLLAHHTAEEFPFLSVPANTRHRTTFHATLARLLFTAVEDDATERQEMYMEPIHQVLQQLSITTQSYRQNESAKQAIIGVCRDLRGITISTHNRKTYGILFEFLYPNYFPVFVRAAEEFFDEPAVTNALLKFMLEFSYNKAQRVMFDQSSPNGILLFQELSKIICAYGQRILVRPVGRSELAYQEKYKGIAICMDILTRSFGGNYVNFGVFQLYNDKALENALDIVIQLALSVSITELMVRTKVSVCEMKSRIDHSYLTHDRHTRKSKNPILRSWKFFFETIWWHLCASIRISFLSSSIHCMKALTRTIFRLPLNVLRR